MESGLRGMREKLYSPAPHPKISHGEEVFWEEKVGMTGNQHYSAAATRLDLLPPVRDGCLVLVRLGHLLLLLALLAAMGGHWTVLQTVAWTNMLANNLRTDSIATALTNTFDRKHPCQLCKQIAAGKKSEKKAEFPPGLKQLEYVSGWAVFVFTAPEVFRFGSESNPFFAALIHQPPVPPPRQLPG